MSVYVIAEVGSVHDGSFGNALHLIDAAAACGVDAVKFQTHIAEAETTRAAPMPPYFKGEPRFDYFRRTGFSRTQWGQLCERCEERGVEFLSSPFSEEAVDLLEEVGMSRYKIPSGEVTNRPLLEKISQLGKPVLLSSGMSSWQELDAAVHTVRRHHDQLTLLQCTSEYPVTPAHVGLNVMVEMRERYGLAVGLSDHTVHPYASLAAVTLGAAVIERHFTFSRLMYGSDARHSLEPAELAELVQGIRLVEEMLGNPVDKCDVSRFGEMKRIFEKSLVAVRPLPAGTVLRREMLGIKKPGTGVPAARLDQTIGRRLTRALAEDEVLQEADLA
ncbi:MAG: N-acetylneuraminate synthase family protein [Chloroflexota bacterium]